MATKEEWNKMVERLQGLIDDEEFVGDITISDEEYEFLISCLSDITDIIDGMSWDDLQEYLKEKD